MTVVGAGIAGLLLAEALDRKGYVVTLLEASDRVGGLIRTSRASRGTSEAAAHSIQATPAVWRLCTELGVELEEVDPDSTARFVWRDGRLRRFPLKPGEVLRTLLRAYFVLADRKAEPARLTLEQWGRRFLGEPALKFLLTPFVRGIYGSRTSEIEVGAAFPALVVPRGHSLLSFFLGRVVRRLLGVLPSKPRGARPVMVAPRGGMGALTGALEARLRERLGERFRTGVPVTSVPEGPNVVLCVPAPAAAELLAGQDPELGSALQGVVYSPLVSVTAFVERMSFPLTPQGVGVLLPEGTSRKTLGVLFNSSCFSGRSFDVEKDVSLTLMMGGSSKPEVLELSDASIEGIARSDLEAIFDLAPGARIETVIHRWPRAVPQYNAAVRGVWDAAARGWCSRPGRVLFGNYTGQVSVRGMIETVSGERVQPAE